MRLLDTNVVLALLGLADEARLDELDPLLAEADRSGERLMLTEAVVAECVWVLRSSFGWSPRRSALALADLLGAAPVSAVDEQVVADALALMADRPKLDIADCLLIARAHAEGCGVLTFDRRLARAV